MKQLELRKTPKGKKILYEVIEDGKVLTSRSSDRVYVAAAVVQNGDVFECPWYFGRMDLVGKGDSKRAIDSGRVYAMATVKE